VRDVKTYRFYRRNLLKRFVDPLTGRKLPRPPGRMVEKIIVDDPGDPKGEVPPPDRTGWWSKTFRSLRGS